MNYILLHKIDEIVIENIFYEIFFCVNLLYTKYELQDTIHILLEIQQRHAFT